MPWKPRRTSKKRSIKKCGRNSMRLYVAVFAAAIQMLDAAGEICNNLQGFGWNAQKSKFRCYQLSFFELRRKTEFGGWKAWNK